MLRVGARRPLEAQGGCEPLHSPPVGPLPGGSCCSCSGPKLPLPLWSAAVWLPWGPGFPHPLPCTWLPCGWRYLPVAASCLASFSFGGPASSLFLAPETLVSAPPESLRLRLLCVSLKVHSEAILRRKSRHLSVPFICPRAFSPPLDLCRCCPPTSCPSRGLEGPQCPGNGQGLLLPGEPIPKALPPRQSTPPGPRGALLCPLRPPSPSGSFPPT